MISIFNGTRRTLGQPTEKDIYAKIDVEFRQYLHHFKGAKLAVFIAISLHINEDGTAFPSYDKLQEETGLGRDTIAQALKDLCEMKIDGNRVLTKWRTRNGKGQLVGNNRYKIFPTEEECQSWENPTLDKSLLEGEPITKEEPIKEKKGVAPPSHPFITAYREQFKRFPNAQQMAELSLQPTHDAAVNEWKAVLKEWAMSGWNSMNVKGQLERFSGKGNKMAPPRPVGDVLSVSTPTAFRGRNE